MYYMIKFDRDWADEFQSQEFLVFSPPRETSVEEIRSAIKTGLASCDEELGFGTNEFFEADEISDRDYTVSEVFEEQFTALSELFGVTNHNNQISFGTGIASSLYYLMLDHFEDC